MEPKNAQSRAQSEPASSDLAGVPTVPLPPLVGAPATGPAGVPTTPLPPVIGTPVILPGPSQPGIWPNGEAEIRFLQAAPSYTALRVTVDARVFAGRLSYRRATSYMELSAGVHTVTITGVGYPRRVYYRAQIPFQAGETLTLAIIQTASGLDLIRVTDSACGGAQGGRACIRAVNLVSGSGGLDVNQFTQTTVFSDVQFREITGYRRAAEGDYSFYVCPSGGSAGDALASFFAEIDAGTPYTFYILGSWGNRPRLRVEVLEDL